jgi:hypothetical protein
MTTVEAFARHSSVWTQVTPTLEQVVKTANTLQASLGRAVMSHGNSERNALIAETAFLLAASGFSIENYQKRDLEAKAREFLLRLPRGQAAQASLTSEEWQEIGEIARVTRWYTSSKKGANFSPRIPGCGVVDAAVGDILSGNELIEIKTVTRPFRAYDVRQALTYATMLYASNYIVETITLLNPRRARVVSMSINQIAAVAGGDSAVQMMQDIMEWMTGLQVSA